MSEAIPCLSNTAQAGGPAGRRARTHQLTVGHSLHFQQWFKGPSASEDLRVPGEVFREMLFAYILSEICIEFFLFQAVVSKRHLLPLLGGSILLSRCSSEIIPCLIILIALLCTFPSTKVALRKQADQAAACKIPHTPKVALMLFFSTIPFPLIPNILLSF